MKNAPKNANIQLKSPFFSILIPTRNRPDLLRDALQSALFQDFDDFEVVVSDNCSDDRTQNVLNEFRDNTRLRCIRPERLLAMPEHWEFASKHAEGAYVLFLTDRSVLKRRALKTICEAINAANGEVEVCTWRWSLYDDVAKREFGDVSIGKEGGGMLSTELVNADFAEGTCQYPYSLPRGLNSCYRKELVNSMREKYGTIFRPINPDFTSAFLLLESVKSLLFIDQALFISQGLNISNGGNAFAKTADTYLQTLGEGDWFSKVPIKMALVENIIFQDYLSIRDLVSGSLKKKDVCWAAYFERCYRELIEKKGARQLSSNEMKNLFAEWSRALAGFDHSVQHDVQRRVKNLRWVKFKAQLKGSALGPFARRLKREIDSVSRRGWKVSEGCSVLVAAGFSGEDLLQ